MFPSSNVTSNPRNLEDSDRDIGYTIIAQIALLLITGAGPVLFFLNCRFASQQADLAPAG